MWCEGAITPSKALERAASVGISHMQTHEDAHVLYINRYDQGWHANCDTSLLEGAGDEEGD